MKRGTKLILLLTALAVLCGAWFAARGISRQRMEVLQEHPAQEHFSIAAGTAEEIRAISWYYFGDAVNLRYDEKSGSWQNAEDALCPINQEAVVPLLEAASSLEASDVIEDVTDFAQYGLEDPAVEVAVAAAEGESIYSVGKSNSTGTWYVRRDGENKVYLETGTLASVFQTSLNELLALESFEVDPEEVTALAVRSEAGDYTLAKPEDILDLWYTDAFSWFLTREKAQPVETERAEELIRQAAEISLSDCVSWNREEADKYGFDQPQAEVDITCGDKQVRTLQFGSYENEFVYVRLKDSALIYRIEGTILDGLLYPDVSAMQPLKPAALNWDLLESITFKLEEGTHEIACIHPEQTDPEDGEEPLTIYKEGSRTLDSEKIASWLDQVHDLSAETRTDRQSGRGSLFTLIFHQNSMAFPQVKISFSVYSSVYHLCVVNDNEYYLVSRTAADAVARDALGALQYQPEEKAP